MLCEFCPSIYLRVRDSMHEAIICMAVSILLQVKIQI